MNLPQGPWYIDDLLTFSVTTHRVDTGANADADSVPSYRVYEDETGTAILTGSMAKLDDANTTGFYSEQVTLSTANGFEAGKSYNIYVTAAVNSITGAVSGAFKMSGVHPADMIRISGNTTAADNLEAGADALVVSTCALGSTTTSIVTNLTESTDDHYNGRVITFTSGALADQSSSITDYNGTTKTLVVVALTEAPANTDAFVIS